MTASPPPWLSQKPAASAPAPLATTHRGPNSLNSGSKISQRHLGLYLCNKHEPQTCVNVLKACFTMGATPPDPTQQPYTPLDTSTPPTNPHTPLHPYTHPYTPPHPLYTPAQPPHTPSTTPHHYKTPQPPPAPQSLHTLHTCKPCLEGIPVRACCCAVQDSKQGRGALLQH